MQMTNSLLWYMQLTWNKMQSISYKWSSVDRTGIEKFSVSIFIYTAYKDRDIKSNRSLLTRFDVFMFISLSLFSLNFSTFSPFIPCTHIKGAYKWHVYSSIYWGEKKKTIFSQAKLPSASIVVGFGICICALLMTRN